MSLTPFLLSVIVVLAGLLYIMFKKHDNAIQKSTQLEVENAQKDEVITKLKTEMKIEKQPVSVQDAYEGLSDEKS